MIFILGGNGFVGSAFVRQCRKLGVDFEIVERDNYTDFIGKTCSVLINANGNSSKILAREQPDADFDQSVQSVRKSLVDFTYDRYVHISSCDVYPDCSSPATTGEDRIIDPVDQSHYGFHKSLAEQCVKHYARRFTIIRCGGFVGPGLKKNAIFDILHGGPLWLDPESELQFMLTDDFAAMTLHLIERGEACGEVFNMSARGVIRLRQVLDLVGHVPVRAGSPEVRYEINLDKVSKLVDLPTTRQTVIEFVKGHIGRKKI